MNPACLNGVIDPLTEIHPPANAHLPTMVAGHPTARGDIEMPTNQSNKPGMGSKTGMQDKKHQDSDNNRNTRQASDRSEHGRTEQNQGKTAQGRSEQGNRNR